MKMAYAIVICRVFMTYVVMIGVLFVLPLIPSVQQIAYQNEPPFADQAELRTATTQAMQLVVNGKSDFHVFSPEEVSHLMDVRHLLTWIFATGIVIFFVSVLFLRSWRVDPEEFYIAIVIILILTCVGTVFFPDFFELFHRIFFPQGNYSFSENSLLIQTFPTWFWLIEFAVLQTGVILGLLMQAVYAGRQKI